MSFQFIFNIENTINTFYMYKVNLLICIKRMNTKNLLKNLLIVSACATHAVHAETELWTSIDLSDPVALSSSKGSLNLSVFSDKDQEEAKSTRLLDVSSVFSEPANVPAKSSSFGSWLYDKTTSFGASAVSKASSIATQLSPLVSTATPAITTMIGKAMGGNYYEHLKTIELTALYDQASWAGKTALTLDWGNALQQAYEKGQVMGGITGHFAGNILVTTGSHLLNGDLFSMNYATNILRDAADTGIKQLLIDGTEAFVVNTSNYFFRHYFYAGAGALLGPAGMAVAIPVGMYLQKSGALDAAIHTAYHMSASGVRMGAELGAKAAFTGTKAAYSGAKTATSYVAGSLSNWWYGSSVAKA